jgi:predicted DNA-binding protein
MKTLTLRIQDSLDLWLTQEANRLGRTKSEIVREALVRASKGRKQLSLHHRMKEVCGMVKGPQDLSTHPKYLEGFGG